MKQFTSPTQLTGALGESVACQYLTQNGYEVIERNFTLPMGEIDIVAKRGGDWLFIEVKASKLNGGRTWPMWQNLTADKYHKCQRTMLAYAKINNVPIERCRMVALLVWLDMGQYRGRCQWYDWVE